MKAFLAGLGMLVSISLTLAPATAQTTYASPDAAVHALAVAVESHSDALLVSVLGREMVDALSSGSSNRGGDWTEKVSLLGSIRTDRLQAPVQGRNRFVLWVGSGDLFPLPMVETSSGWRFGGEPGCNEITKRHVRRNELAAIELCYRYLDAQQAYIRTGWGGAPAAFAQRINSSPGKRDGLHWSITEGAEESPLGPPIARAAFGEQQQGTHVQPYFGYYVKVLLGQGPDAPGGALDYRVGGRLVNGFALVVWPAEYGVSGFTSFVVNQEGDVHRKDLGPDTDHTAKNMAVFNPDRSWTKVRSEIDEE